MNKILAQLLLAILSVSCQTESGHFEDRLDLLSYDPVILEEGRTIIDLGKYFPIEMVPDSIRTDGPFQWSLKDGKLLLFREKENKHEEDMQAEKLYTLMLSYKGIHYSLPLIRRSYFEQTFTYPAFDSIVSIGIVGNFNQWLKGRDTMRFEDQIWKHKQYLPEGTYTYGFVVRTLSGESFTTDPVNPVYENRNDSSLSRLVLENKRCTPRGTINYELDGPLIKLEVEPGDKIYAYWEHFRIETERSDGIRELRIPPFTKYIDSSRVSVYRLRDGCLDNPLVIKLRKDKPAL